MGIPGLTDLTADWIGDLLNANGHDVDVAGVTAVPIGTGQVGATYRLTIDYDHASKGAPETLIAKLPSVDPTSLAAGRSHLTYLRESRFYQHLAGKRPLPIPRFLFIDFDEDSHNFALIMHDLILHRAGNQLAVPTNSDAELSMDAAAAIHAAWWNDPMLDTLDWLNGTKAVPPPLDADALFTTFWPAFCDRYANEITPEIQRVGTAFLGRLAAWNAGRTGARCLIHGDFRADNMLYRLQDEEIPVAVVDWQTVGVGSPAADIGYYIGTSFDPLTRRQIERGLVDRYCAQLIRLGVPAADVASIWDDVLHAAVSGFLMGVTASMVVEQTMRGDAMFLSMVERSAAMILDHADKALPA